MDALTYLEQNIPLVYILQTFVNIYKNKNC